MSVDKRPTHQWIVSVKNMDDVMVNSGESIEIGRKPLRPLPDEGTSRLNVPDETRSMSKRHAVFAVTNSGAATIRDLHSTNGTYIVRSNGDLVRVPLDQDFLLPRKEMTLQFGDVPASFKRHDIQPEHKPVAQQSDDVSDLFSYATDNAPVEPDAADMSVDDILDLRAGEPTSAFDASSVRSRITQLHDAVLGEASVQEPGGETNQPAARQADKANKGTSRAIENPSSLPVGPRDSANAEGTAQAVSQTAQQTGQDASAKHHVPEQRDLFEDALSDALHIDKAHENTRDKTTPDTSQRDEHTNPSDVHSTQSPSTFTPLASATIDNDNAHHAAHMAEAAEQAHRTDADQFAFKPVFEPGSVFEKVSKGEFSKKQHIVEVDGFTSDDARTSHDFSTQFDMARHAELLPFLAMNTSLYDDLYAWLAAQGNHDIDVALQSNTGYQEYLEATRK
ncbi:FHA domain-containing protein [Bifidobacterium aquikefiri]|uniref:variant leucine-rich repeat-containing protein n=1 Tax=Bifidobacterium aquikefiri TaxID=1653207 RepID=UPI0039E838CB